MVTASFKRMPLHRANSDTGAGERRRWYHQESNRGHTDFQSVALPTELWYHSCFFFASAKVRFFYHIILIPLLYFVLYYLFLTDEYNRVNGFRLSVI